MRGVRRVFRLSLLRRRDVTRDVDEEIAFHLAMREARLRAEGLAPADAARVARDRFGDVHGIRDACLRDAFTSARMERSMQWLEEVARDARLAMRSLRRSRAFSVAVILTLALGIGANAVIFSLVRAVVLHPVSGVGEGDRLFELGDVASYPTFRELRQRLPALPLAAFRERHVAVGHGAEVQHVVGALASGNFFRVTGARIALGRALGDSDDVAGAPPVAVIAHEYWTRSFGTDSSVVGRTLLVNGAPVTVVGVAERDFRGLHLGAAPLIWMPLQSWPLVAPSLVRRSDLESPGWEWLAIVGRLEPGTTMAHTEQAVTAAMSTILQRYSRAEVQQRGTLRPLQAAALPSGAREPVVRFATVLSAVVALVLLAACANIAGLLLSRAAYREREIAVRVALGAGRGRLVRQLLTEALVLAGAGGAAGVCLFAGARQLLSGVTLPGGIAASSLALAVDARFVAFAAALTVLTGVLVGLAPALHASRADTAVMMKGAPSGRGQRRQLLRGGLVTAQVAAGVALLIGTGLFARSLTRALAVDVGFDTGHLAVMTVDPGLARLEPARVAAYLETVTERVAAIPGVRGVTWAAEPPLSRGGDRDRATIDGYTPAAGERVSLEWGVVGPRHHEVLGIPIVRGRGFDASDVAGTPPTAVVNETLARRYFAGRDPVGARLTMRGAPLRIVGVARDIKHRGLSEPGGPYVYISGRQLPPDAIPQTPSLIVRTAGAPGAALRAITDAVRAADPRVPVFEASTMADRLRAILAPQIAGVWLLGVFAALALSVAIVGIYGMVAYAVSQRTREIGIRMALGARGANVIAHIVRRNVVFVALGIPIGTAVATLLARGMTEFLFGIRGSDVPTLATATALMLAAGLLASYLPARRAARVDPLVALRE